MSRLAPRLVVLATLAAWVPSILFGLLEPGYSVVRDYISELGASGATHAALVNLTFLMAGALVVATCVTLRPALPAVGAAAGGIALVSLIGVSWLVAGVAPCDAGCPAEGSGRQAVHNLAGLLGYSGGAMGLLWLGSTLRKSDAHRQAAVTTACGAIVLAALVAMAAPALGEVRGLSQRVGEAAVFGWMLFIALRPTGARV